jgi:hypothetical protein
VGLLKNATRGVLIARRAQRTSRYASPSSRLSAFPSTDSGLDGIFEQPLNVYGARSIITCKESMGPVETKRLLPGVLITDTQKDRKSGDAVFGQSLVAKGNPAMDGWRTPPFLMTEPASDREGHPLIRTHHE